MTEEKIKQKSYELAELPTGFAQAIRNPEGEVISIEQLLVQIANKQLEILKELK